MPLSLKYGANPHQKQAEMVIPDEAGFEVLNGTPGFINLLDAFGAWQLVRELRAATGKPSAASFKHTSPAGAAVARPMSDAYKQAMLIPKGELSPVATAYARARGGDRMSSFGDAIAVSEIVDVSLAKMVKREVSDLIIAPGYDPEALEILKAKKGGGYLVLQIDPAYEPPALESRDLFGFTLTQSRDDSVIDGALFENIVGKVDAPLSPDMVETLIVGNIALKYTQSNSICIAYDGQVIGMGAGQQSRVHCTRLACDKADKWMLQQHPKALNLAYKKGIKRVDKASLVDRFLLWDELTDIEREDVLSQLEAAPEPITSEEKLAWVKEFDGVCLCSDAFIPFRDNIDRASRSNVKVVTQAGNSLRDEDVTAAADAYGMAMIHTGLRLFTH